MSTRLFVSNLPLPATEETLITRFCKFGGVVFAYLALGSVPREPS